MTVETPTGRRIGSRERALLILLGVVAALALAFMFLVGGGDDDDLAIIPTPSPGPTATQTPDDDGAVPPPLTDTFQGRDPFQPLVVVGPPAPNGPQPTPTDGATPGPTPAPTATATTVPSDDGERRRVALLDIFRSDGELQATVQVDGREHTVSEGERFADNFRLLNLTRRCGTFVFGDERFTLCIGQEVLK